MKAIIDALVSYAEEKALISPEDRIWAFNRLLEVMQLDSAESYEVPLPPAGAELPSALLDLMCDDAAKRGLIDDGPVSRDLFDTKLMGILTPAPHEVRRTFASLYAQSPALATDWYYAFSQDTNYIRRDRIAKDLKWLYDGEYGTLEITVNLSKPEKDPKAIAAARNAPQTGYPLCQLCQENEGYAGRINHPARQNHRLIPLTINGSSWYFQYSPYVYYNEHCILLNSEHIPMKIDEACFRKLFDFVKQFPHYNIGSNADLPIVGGSILSHDHFQGGRHEFPMTGAVVETPVCFTGFEDVSAGILKWPMSVIRLSGPSSERLIALAVKILARWRSYTDEEAFIFAETEGTPHNTLNPIARKRGDNFELDLVLRNNITTEEHPLGVYHPHAKLHHIKKENIGLIEVMGLAILPGRLKTELDQLREAILAGKDLYEDDATCRHADWAYELMARHAFTPENSVAILRQEVGKVFEEVLEDAGVYKHNETGRAAFLRFIDSVNQ
jgi:UDPglucose--hexose-1-phosphate uridylyltransferase